MSAPLPFDDELTTSGCVTMPETINLSWIVETAGFNPRHDYGEHDGTLASLAESIREVGVLVPPLLVQTGKDTYAPVDGHRRIAASRIAGLTEVNCQVMTWAWSEDEPTAKAAYTPEMLLSRALVANLQRKELNCIEVAEGIARLEKLGKTQADIAKWIGRDQGRVSKTVRLLQLPLNVQISLRVGELSQSHGEELLPMLSESFLPGEIESLALKAEEQGLTVVGLRNVVREKIERGKPKQTTLEEMTDYATSHNSAIPATQESPVVDEVDERIARTLASTKGLDKEPKPLPREDNGLTRKDADAQFAAAMAPDPDVVPLSELPIVNKPKGTFFFLPPDVAEMLFELSTWHRQEHGDLITADEKLADIVRSFHQAKLEQKAEAEAAKAALAATLPVFEIPEQQELFPSLEDDAFFSAFWRCLANHGHEKKLLAFTLPTTRSTVRRFSEMLGEALGEFGGWASPGDGWWTGEQKGGTYPSVKLIYREGGRSREFAFKSGEFLDMAEKAIAWRHAELAVVGTDEPAPAPTDLYDTPQGIADGLDEFAGRLV